MSDGEPRLFSLRDIQLHVGRAYYDWNEGGRTVTVSHILVKAWAILALVSGEEQRVALDTAISKSSLAWNRWQDAAQARDQFRRFSAALLLEAMTSPNRPGARPVHDGYPPEGSHAAEASKERRLQAQARTVDRLLQWAGWGLNKLFTDEFQETFVVDMLEELEASESPYLSILLHVSKLTFRQLVIKLGSRIRGRRRVDD